MPNQTSRAEQLTGTGLEQLLGKVFSRLLAKLDPKVTPESQDELLGYAMVESVIRKFMYAGTEPAPDAVSGIGSALWPVLREMLDLLAQPAQRPDRGRRSKRSLSKISKEDLVRNHQRLLEAFRTKNREMWLEGETTLKAILNPTKYSWPRFFYHRGGLLEMGWHGTQEQLDRIVEQSARRLGFSFKHALAGILSEFGLPYETYRYMIRRASPKV